VRRCHSCYLAWLLVGWELGERPGWITKKISLTASWSLTAISILLTFFFVLRPIDNELGTPAITVMAIQPVLRNPSTGSPFFINVTYKMDANATLIEAASMGRLLTPLTEISLQDQDTDFRRLREWIMAFKSDELSQLAGGETHYTSISPTDGYISDPIIQGVSGGNRMLYVMVVWRYRLPHSSAVFIKEYCAFYAGTFDHFNICPGNHNGTYVAR